MLTQKVVGRQLSFLLNTVPSVASTMEIGPCKCDQCRSQAHAMADCINGQCDCCDLEDMFVMLTGVDVELIKATP
jgi:hypothetical protein